MTSSTIPPRRTRAAVAFAALWVGWICGSLVTWGMELMVSAPIRWGDILFFDVIIGVFAAGSWAISVLPLALFGRQRGWFFHVVPAPVIGAVCGVALLVLEYWIFFDVSPGDLLEGGTSFQDGYLMFVAAIIGAVTWWTYTWTLRRLLRGPAPGS